MYKLTPKQVRKIAREQMRKENVRLYGRPQGPTRRQFVEAAQRLLGRKTVSK